MIREQWRKRPTWLYLILLGIFLLFDSYLGLIHNASIITWSNIFNTQIKWLVLSLEMMVGCIVLVRTILSQSKGRWRNPIAISTPIIILLIGFIVIEILLTGLNRTAAINFNLSAISLSGLYWAAAYLIIATGLTLTYKVQGFANFAQAEMMLVGSYVALTVMWSDMFFQISNSPKDGILQWELLIWAGICAFIITVTIGLIIDKFVYRRLRVRRATVQVMMIASLGVSMIIRALLFMRFSASTFRFIPDRDWRLTTSVFEVPTERLQLHLGDRVNLPIMRLAETVNPYGFAYSKVALIVGVFGSIILLLILLHRTRLGKQMRAVGDNPDLAASSGIHLERIHGSTAFLSAGIAGFGGSLIAAILPINPELGLSLLLPAFAVIVLGTVGSIPGVIVGAIIVGFLRAASEPILIGVGSALDRPTASGFAEVVPFIFLVGLLLLAPKGIGSAIQDWNLTRVRKKISSDKKRGSTMHRDPAPQLSIINSVGAICRIYISQGLRLKDKPYNSLKNSIKYIFTLPMQYISKLKSLIGFTKIPISSFFSPIPIRLKTWIRIDRETEKGSWIMFAILFTVLVCIVWLLPSVTPLTKTMQVARIVTLLGIFGLASFSLNLHTGITGMTNFGVIFFIGVGAVTVGILSAPIATNGYGWSPWMAGIVAVLISAIAGWLLAYPTARLRMDYFAIVTISMGEMLRISLQAEPLLRAGTVTSAIGISQYSRPLEKWWESGMSEVVSRVLGLHVPAPYIVFLACIATVSLLLVWVLLNTVLSSPWGRILRSIREDELVSQHHGHNILIHKAASLALGAAVAALAGVLWAWLNTNIWPDFMNPVRSTFLIWAAFIVGGRGNNRGMIIGAFLIVILEFILNIMVASRGASSLPLHTITIYLDSLFSWLIVNVGGIVWSARSITEIFPRGDVLLSLPHLKLSLIGLVIVGALLTASKGILPEVPSKPKRYINKTSSFEKKEESNE